jgi:drug/metabolite transporter (DMT)-like permease
LPTPSKQRTAELLLFATTFIWSSTFVALKWGLEELTPLWLMAWRFSAAAAAGALILLWQRGRLSRAALRDGHLLGLLLFAGFALQTIGLRYTTASKSAFITGLMVAFTPMVQYLWNRRLPTRANLLGILVVIGGLWLLTSPEGDGSGFNPGDAMTLLCAVAFACYMVALDHTAHRHAVLPYTIIQVATMALYSWAGALLLEAPTWPNSGRSLGVILYLAFAATLLTGYLMTRYQRDTTPTRAVIIYTVEPVWATLMAAALLGERLTLVAMSGGGLILVGVLLSQLGGGSKTVQR